MSALSLSITATPAPPRRFSPSFHTPLTESNSDYRHREVSVWYPNCEPWGEELLSWPISDDSVLSAQENTVCSPETGPWFCSSYSWGEDGKNPYFWYGGGRLLQIKWANAANGCKVYQDTNGEFSLPPFYPGDFSFEE